MWGIQVVTPVILITIMTTGLISPAVKSMRFDVASGTSKCITEEINRNAMTFAKYSVVNPNPYPNGGYSMPDNHRITVRVTSATGNSHHIAEQVESGTFAFTADEGGHYAACFWVKHQNPSTTLAVELDWRSGVAAKGRPKFAKKGQLQAVEIELIKLYETIISIHDEMFHLRGREEEMQALNRATHSTMITFSFLSLLVCICVAGLQLWHLKTFCESKKLLYQFQIQHQYKMISC